MAIVRGMPRGHHAPTACHSGVRPGRDNRRPCVHLWRRDAQRSDPPRGLVGRMPPRHHRGPDATATTTRPGELQLRLAIVDLDPRGLMPMATPDGRYRIVQTARFTPPQLREERCWAACRYRRLPTPRSCFTCTARWRAHARPARRQFAFAIWTTRQGLLAAATASARSLLLRGPQGRLLFASEPRRSSPARAPRVNANVHDC